MHQVLVIVAGHSSSNRMAIVELAITACDKVKLKVTNKTYPQ